MRARLLRLHPKSSSRLVRLSKEAERDGAYRVAKRLQAVVLNAEGRTSGELAEILKAPRSKVSAWLSRYQAYGIDGLLEGYRSGRPPQLSEPQRKQLGDIQWPSGLRTGQRSVDLADDCLGDRRGVRRHLPSRTCAQVPSWSGLLRATSPASAGARRCSPARSLAPAYLSQP